MIRRIRISFEVRHETQAYICAVNGKIGEASFRKQALDLGVTVTEIDRKPLEAALTGLYTKVLTDSHSKHLVEAIQRDR